MARTALTLSDCVFTSSNQIIDTHAHYNLEPLYERWPELWAKAQSMGIQQTVVASINLATSQRAVEIVNQAEGLWALVGVHPSEVSENLAGQVDQSTYIEQLAQLLQDQKVLGIGEIGLDYYWLADEQRTQQAPIQQNWFRAQLELARQHGGWLSLHIRDKQTPSEPTPGNAYWDAYAIMSEYDWSQQPFILHCASGSPEYVQAMLDLGAYVGFDGNITYPKAEELRELLALVPRDRILIETDAPYLPPQTYRGQVCEPWMIVETAKFLESQI